MATVSGSTIFEATPIAPDAGWVVTDRLLAATDAAGVVRSSVGLPSIEGDLGSGVQAFIDADHAVVARPDNSSGGVVVIGTDDRLTTSFRTDIEAGFARSQPIGLAFADPLHGWLTVADADSEQAAGSRGALYRTVDGGRSFDRISDDAPAPLAFVDEQTGWATGSGLYLTRDSGATWTQLFPPNWDAEGPAPGGPWYTVEAIDSTHAVVRQQAPTGMQAQVRYYATDDLGTTWRDVTPPGTSEVSNTGPQTWLAPSSDTHIVGLTEQMGPLPAATWLTSSDGGETYSATQLRFAGVGVSMLDQQTGWIRTPTELWSTSDSGNTWTQLAIAIAPFDTEPGCTWQPELAGSEGAGGTFLNWFSIRNLADRPCDWPTVIAVTASSLLDGTDVEITHGDDTIPLTNPIAVGASVQLTFYSSTTYMHCSDTQPDRSTPITAFRVEFENTTSSQLPIILEGTCTVGYSVTNQP